MFGKDKMEDFTLQNLNQAQRQAVECTEGPVLVLAGAGSGKTRVLTHRIAYIINQNLARPYEILAVTFTNKAANEMKERICKMADGGIDVWVSTIHSFCTSVLRRFIELLGYKKSFTIYSEEDTERVIKRILREKHVEEESGDILSLISYAKSQGITPENFSLDLPSGLETETMQEVYKAYTETMKNSNALDFDDLLIKVAELFENFPEALEYYQNKLKYIHVDEFQDTNEIQLRIIKMLASKRRNLFVVGDDDQSIYGWRGANIENILNFDKDYPDAHVFKLEENYRSTPEILNVANNVIKNNKSRHQKTLYTERKNGTRVEYFSCYNDREEAERIISTIRNLKYYNGYQNKDFAILVRNNSLTRMFEQNLNSSRINYKVFGGFKFFDRKEVLDVFAYLRIFVNPDDNEAVERIINFPRRGIGETTVEKLVAISKENGVSLFDLIANIEKYSNFVSSATIKKLNEFYSLISDLIADYKEKKLDEFVKCLVEKVDFENAYTTYDKDGKQKEDDYNRWLNIQELVSYTKQYVDNTGSDSLEDFLTGCTLQSKGDIDSGDFVTIATIHAVKGLEFPVVFIVACEENILPSQKTIRENENGVEEERRLMYVAATRAKDKLYISYTSQRFLYGQTKASLPSRFITEARGELQPKISSPNVQYVQHKPVSTYATKIEPQLKTIEKTPPQKKSNDDIKKFVSGAVVTHPRYGDGTVIVVMDDTVTVLFKDVGVKKFVLSVAPLTVK